MVQLRVILDQIGSPVEAENSWVARSIARGLIETAPTGCEVTAIVPSGAEDPSLTGLAAVQRLRLPRRELAAAWQFGIPTGVGGGMIHAASLFAPLTRHDRVHDHDQTVVTIWDLTAWEHPELLPKSTVAWQRAMLRRAGRHADAIVVPSHAMAERLGEIAPLGDRVRVIAGAAPAGFAVPADAVQRREDMQVPERYLVIVGDSPAAGFRAAAEAGLPAVVLEAAEGAEPRLADIASASGLPERQIHVRGRMSAEDRASVLGAAAAVASLDATSRWPWRIMEAMALGIPVVALDSGVHRDVIAEGGLLVAEEAELTDAVREATDDTARAGVRAKDRSRAFSWASSGERIWALHAEL